MVDKNASQDEKSYTCGKCRQLLFTSKDIQDHNSDVKKHNARPDKLTSKTAPSVCSSYFLEFAEWMNTPVDGETQ